MIFLPKNGFMEAKFCRQRFYSSQIGCLLETLSDRGLSKCRSIGLYTAFAYVVNSVPNAVLVSNTKKLIPHMVAGVDVLASESRRDTRPVEALIDTLILMIHSSRDDVVDHGDTLLAVLCGLLKPSVPISIRVLSLTSIRRLAECFPHSLMYPQRMEILGTLTQCLDDDSRRVRSEAAKCRSDWLEKYSSKGSIVIGN